MSAVFVSQVERGLANPSFDTLLRLAQALGMRLRDLVREV